MTASASTTAEHTPHVDTSRAEDPGGLRVWQIRALLAGVALLLAGNGLQATLVGVRAGLENMSDTTIGLIMSAYFAGFAIGTVVAPRLIESVGHIRAYAALASIASALSLVFVIVVSPPVWMVLRALHGASYAGLLIVIETWLNGATGRDQRGHILAMYMIVFYAGWAASQPMLLMASPGGFVLFCLVSVCLSLSLVPITLSRAGVPGVVTADRPKLSQLYRISPFALFGSGLTGLAASAFFGMAPTFGQRIGLSEAGIAALIGLMLLGALALQWPFGWLSDRVDRRLVALAAAAASVAVSAGMTVMGPEAPLWSLLGLSFLLGGTLMPVYSLCVAHANDQIERNDLIAVASGLILIYGFGSVFGPFAASVLMGSLGPTGLFAFIGGTGVLILLMGVWRLLVAPAPDMEVKQGFVAVPHTSHAAYLLHRHGPGVTKGETAPR
ncbi:MFS transporter [Roseospira navarrensis]|uniref:MFS transporter n=1 Tax=Roseospira navarrensis TaxID=140058 RepID=UPI001478E065